MRFSSLIVIALVLVVAACAGPAAKTYTYTLPPTPGGRLCSNQCLEANDYCTQVCSINQRSCVNKAQARASEDYDRYTREQFGNRQPIELHPRDFERTQDCDEYKQDCTDQCTGHYQTCYQSCGGSVSSTTSCQFMCF